MIASCPERESLQALLEDALPGDEQAALGSHLEQCASCQETLQGLVAADRSWSDAAAFLKRSPVEAGEGLRRIVATFEAQNRTVEIDVSVA